MLSLPNSLRCYELLISLLRRLRTAVLNPAQVAPDFMKSKSKQIQISPELMDLALIFSC